MRQIICSFFILLFIITLFNIPAIGAPAVDASTQKYINAYKAKIYEYNSGLSDKELDAIVLSILYYSRKYGVEPRFVVAVIACESAFDVHATSCAGAQGLGQLMPGTASDWGVSNPYNPVQNVCGTVQILQYNLKYFSGRDVESQCKLALAAYNAGLGAVQQYGGVPPYAETQNYVEIVYNLYKELCGAK